MKDPILAILEISLCIPLGLAIIDHPIQPINIRLHCGHVGVHAVLQFLDGLVIRVTSLLKVLICRLPLFNLLPTIAEEPSACNA